MLANISLLFQDELEPNEHILWSGRPKFGLVLRSTDIFHIPLTLLWSGLIVFGAIVTIIAGLSLFVSVLFIPFILFGVERTLGRFFLDVLQRRKTYYVLTNERVIIISGLVNRNVKSLSLQTLSDIRLYQKRDRSGTITFGPRHLLSRIHEGDDWWPGRRNYLTPGFYMINEVKEAYDRIRKAQRNVNMINENLSQDENYKQKTCFIKK